MIKRITHLLKENIIYIINKKLENSNIFRVEHLIKNINVSNTDSNYVLSVSLKCEFDIYNHPLNTNLKDLDSPHSLIKFIDYTGIETVGQLINSRQKFIDDGLSYSSGYRFSKLQEWMKYNNLHFLPKLKINSKIKEVMIDDDIPSFVVDKIVESGIDTIGQLIDTIDTDIPKIRHFGKKYQWRIKIFLRKNNMIE